ncbi:hypothetical protein LTS08_001314 [Lithohypha guttulata]|uniref:RCC1-like domain-containing protein n=1 Tax=Lithohypha guttulata TaxID=1690604 RepID=A0AAN7SUD3_9EURO|nr:hypothetical protein LTR51_007685 [Lithohypha guttulata]KAK5081736.1 hypothetical protein LTR05_007870 [Lithohypha guttulata]KAK5105041.1 hypothetical protein LTS08_001314 [Lithohypha guttulata]
MPPKKAASGAAPARKSTRTKAEPAINGVSKPEGQPKKAAASKTTKANTKAPLKTTSKNTMNGAKEPAKKTNKRKAEDEVDEEPQVQGNKRARKASSVSERGSTAEAAPARRKIAAAKAPAAKRTRTVTAINHAPTEPLNVYVFGDGTNGELGLGTGKNCSEVKRPRLNNYLAGDSVGVVHVSVGGMHTAVLTRENKILTWGVNDQGALGRSTDWEGGLRDMDADDDESDSDAGTNLNPKESTPTEIALDNVPEGTVWTQLACSDSATFALTNDGLVYGCGTFRSNEGIFGFSPDILVQRTLVQITELKKITKLVAGANHILALDNKGQVFAWGSGQQNQLGRRILERFLKNSLVPTQFGLPKQMVNIGAGAYHSFAMHKNGKLYSWGLNSFGETGVTDNFEAEGETDVHHPKVVPNLEKYGNIVQVEGGSHHTIARTDQGEVLVWGRLDGYQLGIKVSDLPQEHVIKDSSDHPRILKAPTQVPGIDAVAVAAGSDHSIAISKDGKAYAWGFSASYQTGLGTDDEVEVATHIDNTATRGKQLVWAGAGGQFSVIAGLYGKDAEAPAVNGLNGHA